MNILGPRFLTEAKSYTKQLTELSQDILQVLVDRPEHGINVGGELFKNGVDFTVEQTSSNFKKYQHLERFGTSETEGITEGYCYIFPKIDGTNASVWFEEGKIWAGSRNRPLSLENDNAGFLNAMLNTCAGAGVKDLFEDHPTLRLYGEWLVPHSLKTYDDDSWRTFYVFDVYDGEKPMNYEQYQELMTEYGIEYIPPICKIKNPTLEALQKCLDKNTFLIKDGMGIGEGIVVKNYNYQNRHGRQTWAKIVTNEFKALHGKVMGAPEVTCTKYVEEQIVEKYVTEDLIRKVKAKIENDEGSWSSKFIPRLLGDVFYDLVREDSWNFLKDFKFPVVDFKRLRNFCNQKIKYTVPEVF